MGGWRRIVLVGVLALGTVVLAPSAPAGAEANEAPGAPLAVRSVAGGLNHNCILLDDGSVKCFGDGAAGALGTGDTVDRGSGPGQMGTALPAVDLGTGRTATAVSAGGFHTCALLDNGQVKCWGSNGLGELGLGDNANRGDDPNEMGDALPPVDLGVGRTATAISAGFSHTCAILDNDELRCWGGNALGQLGIGANTARGDNPSEMGANLPAVSLGTGRTAVAITALANNTCALLDDDTVKCWGYAGYGVLGNGQTTPNRGDNSGEMGDSLAPVPLIPGKTPAALSGGNNFVCVLYTDGGVSCWGINGEGQLGQGNQTNRGDSSNEMGANLPLVPLGATATSIATNTDHTCAVLTGGTVKCWGWNDLGQLGQGDDDNRGDDPGEVAALAPIALPGGLVATSAWTGGEHSCAGFSDGTYRCWGRGDQGQLGQQNPTHLGDDASETAVIPAIDLGGAPPVPTCDGLPVTVDLNEAEVPTAGPDVILGTPGPDTINALGGADRICGGGGIDAVNGGAGNDRVFGEAGADKLTGGTGNDRLDGGTQNDTLNGGDGLDTLLGGAGNDTANGGNQNDSVSGGDGNDRLNGQNHNDTLNGQVGADILDGGANNDRLNGGTQRDTCHGRTGTDSQSGCEVRTGIP